MKYVVLFVNIVLSVSANLIAVQKEEILMGTIQKSKTALGQMCYSADLKEGDSIIVFKESPANDNNDLYKGSLIKETSRRKMSLDSANAKELFEYLEQQELSQK